MPGFTTLFATRLYQARLGRALVRELERSCLALARDDGAGRRWSRAHGYKGYTSYASLDDLPRRDPAFAELAAALDRHVRIFARDAAFDLSGRKLVLDSLWVNVMAQGGVHAAHIHPHAVVSGTFYVAVPPGAGAIRFEDPRLAMMMAAPPRKKTAPAARRSFVTVQPKAGQMLLWESWLRHGVDSHGARGQRISVSFNYRLG
jgi:uncharacterized protein (TIGR02466 family)